MEMISLSEGWHFRKASEQGWQTVCVPHDAMRTEKRDPDCPSGAATGFWPGGSYIYEKTLDIPAEY